MAICAKCSCDFPDKRHALGFDLCIVCGDKYASLEKIRKSKCIAPLFNKGAYQYVGSIQDARNAGR